MCLPRFDIDQGTVAPDFFKRYTNSLCYDYFQKKFFLMTTTDILVKKIFLGKERNEGGGGARAKGRETQIPS